MPRLAVERWEQEHRKRVAEYLRDVDALFEDATEEMVHLGKSYAYDPATGKPFKFSNNKSRAQSAKETTEELHKKLMEIISAGIASEWDFANNKADSWVTQLFSDPERAYMLRNLEAMKAFQNRKIYGHTLSQRVWEYSRQFQEQIELALSVGLTEGRSAARISQDVRAYLNEPDRLFRRVRDQFGNLTLSRSARAYHPGQGVYRSSYQNAMRMARTEINAAYRESDHQRWQQLDFIVGYEVKTSKTHEEWLEKAWYPRFKNGQAPLEICDAMAGRYPKDFKFIGWHPNCKCYAVPILANEDNDLDFWDAPKNEVKDVPEGFKKWMKENAGRIEGAENRGTTPYWIKENPKYTNLNEHRITRRKEILEIVKASDDRVLYNEQFGKKIVMTNTGIKEWLNQPHKNYITKNEMLLNIKQVMKDALYLGSGPDMRKNDTYIHLFETKMLKEKSWIIVKEFNNGLISLYSISDSEKILKVIK